MSVLAVIPARGGSKGVHKKNLRTVGGRSLLQRAISACLESIMVNRVLVSTDDDVIHAAALAAGAESVLRPSELATDFAPTLPVVQHAMEFAEKLALVETIVLVEPTSPFRTAVHIDAAVRRFNEGDCRSVTSVCALERKPENIFIKQTYLRRYIQSPTDRFPRRQDMAHLCRINSALYVAGRHDVLAGTLLPDPVGWIEMDHTSSINIDDELDLSFADFVAQRDGL